ncbi:MAG: flavin reductase [Dehalococcoidia bacterium]|nr:flavin reductase [Dehalococcoidia bacterium]
MSEQRISVLSHFWAPLCAIGSRGPKGPNAQICVSVFGASIVPERPRLLVVLSKTNYTTELVAASGTFAVTVLAEAQAGLLEPLGLHSGREVSKLAGIAHTLTAMGDPAFGGAGSIACEVLRTDFGGRGPPRGPRPGHSKTLAFGLAARGTPGVLRPP